MEAAASGGRILRTGQSGQAARLRHEPRLPSSSRHSPPSLRQRHSRRPSVLLTRHSATRARFGIGMCVRELLLRRRLGHAGVRTDEIAECRKATTLFMAHLSNPVGPSDERTRMTTGAVARAAGDRSAWPRRCDGKPAVVKDLVVSAAKTSGLCALERTRSIGRWDRGRYLGIARRRHAPAADQSARPRASTGHCATRSAPRTTCRMSCRLIVGSQCGTVHSTTVPIGSVS